MCLAAKKDTCEVQVKSILSVPLLFLAYKSFDRIGHFHISHFQILGTSVLDSPTLMSLRRLHNACGGHSSRSSARKAFTHKIANPNIRLGLARHSARYMYTVLALLTGGKTQGAMQKLLPRTFGR